MNNFIPKSWQPSQIMSAWAFSKLVDGARPWVNLWGQKKRIKQHEIVGQAKVAQDNKHEPQAAHISYREPVWATGRPHEPPAAERSRGSFFIVEQLGVRMVAVPALYPNIPNWCLLTKNRCRRSAWSQDLHAKFSDWFFPPGNDAWGKYVELRWKKSVRFELATASSKSRENLDYLAINHWDISTSWSIYN